ncbi:HNH endonuclease [Luteimonas sp. SX5]|uniref:HNH endonuclease n=1 Tax=Luteimonas galliterrae TaxID=2940486 RepID=A0ABT0MF05_9GAMM|nr:HNH endonuclease signature motif containing protein [Luteimonas galliterrae]MCL1633248.1 HNH endonuclease [Luteimonas galliterrae]
MKGTQHFSRMNYNVRRGLREIVAPDHRVSKQEWALVLTEFGGTCAYCGATASAENRGIVPDHLVAVTDFGELVPGNIVPACQTCNDSRGNKPWREFLAGRFPADAAGRIKRIEQYIAVHNYSPRSPESSLTPDELVQYNGLVVEWEFFLAKAQELQSKVAQRRSLAANNSFKPKSLRGSA